MAKSPIKILGVTTEKVSDFRVRSHRKGMAFYAALDRRYNVVGIVQPSLSKIEKYVNNLCSFRFDQERRISQRSLNPWNFKRRTTIAERQLQHWDGNYDIIVQLHTLISAGLRYQERPYVLYTDNNYLLSERHYPPWAPLSRRQRDERVHLERQTFNHAEFLFPYSEWLRRSFIEDYGCAPERVIRVGLGANMLRTSLDDKRYDGQIALFVGTQFVRKGGLILLQAWERVRQRLPEAELWIIGPKQPHVPEHPGIRWLGFIGDRQELAQLYALATLFVMPSLFEPWGNVFLEAMGSGVPCIGTHQGALPELIQEGENGMLVPPGEPEPLADCLVSLLENPELARMMGHRAHATVLQEYTWDAVVARMAPYIEQSVAERNNRR